MNKTIAIIVVLIIIIGGFFLFRGRSAAPTQDDMNAGAMDTASSTPAVTTTASSTPVSDATHKTITVTGSSFKFDPATITVNKGNTVTIHFVNSGGMHDWVIDEFNARTPRIQSGQTADVTFVADKTGSFEYYCSVGTHRQMGMKGTLIVK